MERYRTLFLDESLKHLQAVEERMLSPEPFDRPALDAVFREMHSLKGMAASMGYAAMAALSHRLEDLLDGRRKAGADLPEAVRDLCLRVCDRLGEMRDDVAAGGSAELDWSDLARRVEEVEAAEGEPGGAGEDGLRVRVLLAPDCGSPAARAYLVLLRFREEDPAVTSRPTEAEILGGVPVSHLDLTLHGLGRDEVEAVYAEFTEVAGLEFPGEGIELGPEADDLLAPAPDRPEEAEEEPADGVPQAPREEARVRLPETVQVPVALLDVFVDVLGEMTISRGHLEATARTLGSELLKEEVNHLGGLVRSFHERVMGLRMLPFSLISGTLKRLVREHAAQLGKEVDLALSGEEIGMDKSILLQLSDPLVHLLRNALDHGLETPEERRQKGKPPRGRIRVAVARARNRVEVTVADDGRGIDVEAVRRQAVERGIFREEESRRLSNTEIFSCLFRPGFSTRTSVTELSGRGVGLDVVKTKADALGGALVLTSTPGAGTEVRLSLPLSVAIVPVLLVGVGASALALPTASVVRTVEAQPRDVRKKDGRHVLLTEEGQVPILSLARVLRLKGRRRFDRVPLVLAQTGSGVVALAVDRFLREEDLFIKPLRGPLRALQGLSGYSVLGDGRLVFLLDPPTLLRGGD
jgi:two-component system chemotaxis sensor kinase CheA